MTDFGMARDVQQENIYERKTKVIKKEGRWGRYYISFSLLIFQDHCCGKADIFLISDHEFLEWDPNEKICHAYTSTTLTISVFD